MSTIKEESPAIIEEATNQSTESTSEKGNGDTKTSEIHAEKKISSSKILPPSTDPTYGTNVHCESQEMKPDMSTDHAPLEISDNCEVDLITKSNSNANNNGNGDDPSNQK